ncbi:unnamed protein product, partial [Laminaria digitata]
MGESSRLLISLPRTMVNDMHDEEGDHRLQKVNPLLRAVILDLPSTVKNILAAGVDANVRHEYGSGDITALEAATLLQRLGVVRALVEHGVEINGIGVGGRTALQNAVMLNDRVDLDLIDLLLSAGAEIDARTADGSTALHMAADRPGNIAALLLQRGAAKHALDNEGRSPLHLAAQCGNPVATRALLAAGADANIRYISGYFELSPLHVAARCTPPQTMMAMYDEEGDLRPEVNILLQAVIRDLPSTVRHILVAGVDANIRYKYGDGDITALEAATLLQRLGVVRALVEHGVEVNGIGVGGRTVLQNAVMLNDRVDVDLVDLLLSAGADIDARTTEGSTALHMAADRSGDTAAVLLQRGAARDALDPEGRSPLHLAAQCGNLAATRALLAAGADTNIRYDSLLSNLSPLDVAARCGQIEVIREFARHGVDMNVFPWVGSGSLHAAASANQAGSVDALIEVGASIDAQTSHCVGTTPLHSAATFCALEAMLALLRHGGPVLALPPRAPEEGGTGRRNRSPLHLVARMGIIKGAAKMVDLLLRWGADESELDGDGKTAAEHVGYFSEMFDFRSPVAAADDKRILELLTNAPADRVWRRRRGLLLLCLARNHIETRKRRSCGGEGEGKCVEDGALVKDGGGRGGGGGGIFQSRADVEASAATAGGDNRERTPSKLGGLRAMFGGVSGSGC